METTISLNLTSDWRKALFYMDFPSTNDQDQQRRRHNILSAAARLFLEVGFDNTSMQQIAQCADVSKQTLYSHFGSKEALFMEAITSACRAHTPEGLEVIANMSLEDTLKSIGRHLCELMFSESAVRLESICIAGTNSHPEVSRLYWKAGPEWIRNFLVQCIQTQIDNGRLATTDPEIAAKQFIALLSLDKKHKLLLGIEKVESEEIGEIVDQAVNFFVRAMKA